jgi:phosphoglycerate dehydrogenase-like enzyme
MTQRPLVLVIAKPDDAHLSLLADVPHVVVSSPADLGASAHQAEVIFFWAGSRDLLRVAFLAAPNLRWVHSRAAGLDNALFPELVDSTIPLTNSTGVFSQSLGEFALAAILYFAKDLRRMLRNQEAGRWAPFDVEEIAGQTAGIVGYGDIGRAVARCVQAMGMRVLALKRHVPESPDLLIAQFFRPQELKQMLALCDYVVAAAPLTPETRHMLSDGEFAAMRRNAVLINIGRGPVVDQAALIRALQANLIKGAGLDVFEVEPIPEGDPIYKFENVLVSPHCADHTKDWLNQTMRFFIEQYERFVSGEPLKNVVDKRLGY